MGRVGGWVGWLDDGLLGLITCAFSSDIHSVCMEVLYCTYAVTPDAVMVNEVELFWLWIFIFFGFRWIVCGCGYVCMLASCSIVYVDYCGMFQGERGGL